MLLAVAVGDFDAPASGVPAEDLFGGRVVACRVERLLAAASDGIAQPIFRVFKNLETGLSANGSITKLTRPTRLGVRNCRASRWFES